MIQARFTAVLFAGLLLSGTAAAQSAYQSGDPLARILGPLDVDEESEVIEQRDFETSSATSTDEAEAKDEESEKKQKSAKKPARKTVSTWSGQRQMWGTDAANSGHWRDSLIGQQAFGSALDEDGNREEAAGEAAKSDSAADSGGYASSYPYNYRSAYGPGSAYSPDDAANSDPSAEAGSSYEAGPSYGSGSSYGAGSSYGSTYGASPGYAPYRPGYSQRYGGVSQRRY